MKTLIITNFQKEEGLSTFKKKFADELKRDDVIFIQNPNNKADLERSLKSHQGEFSTVVVITHGGNGAEIPTMGIVGEDVLAITDVIKTINKDNEQTLKKIHLTSCLIGANFGKIEQKDAASQYYLELEQSLRDGQILFLHGDSYTGDIEDSLGKRLKKVIENKDYSASEAVFDSAEAISVVIKKHHNLRGSASLETFSCQPFGRKGEEFSTTSLRTYLNDFVTKARDFENVQGILNGDVSEQRLENLSEDDLRQDLSARFFREVTKAIDGNHLGMVGSLVKKIDPNLPDKNGWTALMRAADGDQTEIARLLLENEKIDPNLPDKNGWTALMRAANKGYDEIARLLLENEKINPNLPDKNGWTALMRAADGDQTEIVKLLLENEKIDPNLTNADGWTALMIAADGDQTEIVRLLLENEKIDPDLRNKDGWTALTYATYKGHVKIIELLSQAIEKKHQNTSLEEWKNHSSPEELEEMPSNSSNFVPDFLGQNTEAVDFAGDSQISWDGNKKVPDLYLQHPLLRGGKVSPSTKIENGTAILLFSVSAAIVKFVAAKFNPTKTPKPADAKKIKKEDYGKEV